MTSVVVVPRTMVKECASPPSFRFEFTTNPPVPNRFDSASRVEPSLFPSLSFLPQFGTPSVKLHENPRFFDRHPAKSPLTPTANEPPTKEINAFSPLRGGPTQLFPPTPHYGTSTLGERRVPGFFLALLSIPVRGFLSVSPRVCPVNG